jgi:hypothetical protein
VKTDMSKERKNKTRDKTKCMKLKTKLITVQEK